MIGIDSHFVLYFFVIIIIIYLIFTAYIRINMRFWYTQPVFHIYNLKYWINPPGFINTEPPESNKFVNLINNKLITINSDGNTNNTDSIELSKICNFIKNYYVINENARYSPSEEDIFAYLHCSNHPSFFNIYQEPMSPLKTNLSHNEIGNKEINHKEINELIDRDEKPIKVSQTDSEENEAHRLINSAGPRQYPTPLDSYEGYAALPKTYANDYYKQYVPFFNQSEQLTKAGITTNKDQLLEKLNYMIHLLEEQKDEKTGHVMEEVILYSFLGVFIIFIVDSFARAGKYTR